jgi:tRNA nucleotidyltransferase/poly(A) polymerase
MDLARQAAPYLAQMPGERIGKELLDTLANAARDRGIALLRELGCTDILVPELEALSGIEQGGYHHLDALSHSLEVVRIAGEILDGSVAPTGIEPEVLAEARKAVLTQPLVGVRTRPGLMALAGLLHDIGKAPCREVRSDGRIRFTGHEAEGASMAGSIARRFRLTGRETQYLRAVVKLHMRPCMLGAEVDPPTPRALGRLLREARSRTPDVGIIALADRLAARGPAATEDLLRRQASAVDDLLAMWLAQSRRSEDASPLITGLDVMRELSVSEGPLVGEVLAEVQAATAAGEVDSRQEALEVAREFLASKSPSPGQSEVECVDG